MIDLSMNHDVKFVYFYRKNSMQNFKVNIAVQLLPLGTAEAYSKVDEAISLIGKSGLKYKVCPFETVIEGDYDTIMKLVRDIQLKCLESGVTDTICNLKIQMRKDSDVTIGDKMEKYE
jgi:uncharacterized protein (TIGR00106 family)